MKLFKARGITVRRKGWDGINKLERSTRTRSWASDWYSKYQRGCWRSLVPRAGKHQNLFNFYVIRERRWVPVWSLYQQTSTQFIYIFLCTPFTKNAQVVLAWWKQHWTMFRCQHCSRLSAILFNIVTPDCMLIQAHQRVQYCWQPWTMWAAQHCSILFSSGQNKLFIFLLCIQGAAFQRQIIDR